MNQGLKCLIALTLAASSLLAQAADPVVEGRAEMTQAKEARKAAEKEATDAAAPAKAAAKKHMQQGQKPE